MRLGLDEEWCELKGCGLSHDALLSWEYRGPNKKNKEYIVSLKPSGCSGRDKSWNIIEGNVTRVSVVPTWATPIQHSQHCFPDITVAGSIEISNWAFGTCNYHGICSAPAFRTLSNVTVVDLGATEVRSWDFFLQAYTAI
jgi:hypothetical protein